MAVSSITGVFPGFCNKFLFSDILTGITNFSIEVCRIHKVWRLFLVFQLFANCYCSSFLYTIAAIPHSNLTGYFVSIWLFLLLWVQLGCSYLKPHKTIQTSTQYSGWGHPKMTKKIKKYLLQWKISQILMKNVLNTEQF